MSLETEFPISHVIDEDVVAAGVYLPINEFDVDGGDMSLPLEIGLL